MLHLHDAVGPFEAKSNHGHLSDAYGALSAPEVKGPLGAW